MHVAVVHLLFSVATQCRDNWYYYNGNCYYPSTEEATQSDARAKCQAMDADLTSIIDEKEKDFVLSISYELSHIYYYIAVAGEVSFSAVSVSVTLGYEKNSYSIT